jgi:putative phosphatase
LPERLRSWLEGALAHFEPFRRARRVADIDYEELWALGLRGIVFDLENTLALYRSDALVEGNLELLARLTDRGFSLGIVSNSRRRWVESVATPLGIPFIGDAGKPRASAFQRVIREIPVPTHQLVMVGDQRLTDVFGAQRMGLRAILVEPLGPAEPLTSRAQRRIVPLMLRAGRRLSRRSPQ